MKVPELRRRGAQYFSWYFLITVVSIGVAVVWPEFGGVPESGVALIAAIQTLRGFLKQHDALPSRLEFWQMVGVGTAAALVIEAMKSGLFFYAASERPAGNTLLILMVGIVAFLLPNMLGFSRVFGGDILLKIRKKRQKVAAGVVTKG